MTDTYLQDEMSAFIQEHGQQLTVRRASPTTTRTVWFLPRAVQTGGNPISPEGAASIADPDTMDFRAAFGSDVKQRDLILDHDGSNWRIQSIIGNPLNGMRPCLHCIAGRE